MPSDDSAAREAAVIRISAAHERLMGRLMSLHREDFLEIDMTMSQAKLLYLITYAGQLHMSTLPAILGVSLSTVSGTVDRLVEHGLVDRRSDPTDRRQVVLRPTAAGIAAFDRLHELNVRVLRDLLDRVDLPGIAHIEHAYALLLEAAASIPGAATDAGLGDPATAH